MRVQFGRLICRTISPRVSAYDDEEQHGKQVRDSERDENTRRRCWTRPSRPSMRMEQGLGDHLRRVETSSETAELPVAHSAFCRHVHPRVRGRRFGGEGRSDLKSSLFCVSSLGGRPEVWSRRRRRWGGPGGYARRPAPTRSSPPSYPSRRPPT
jgi:hypothetical protein